MNHCTDYCTSETTMPKTAEKGWSKPGAFTWLRLSVSFSIFGCAGVSVAAQAFLRLQYAASHWGGFSSQSPTSRAHGLQQSWYMVLVAPRQVGSSWIRDPIRVSCVGRWIPYHRASREALSGCKRTLGKAKQELGGGRWGGGWGILNPESTSLDSGCEQGCHTVKCL